MKKELDGLKIFEEAIAELKIDVPGLIAKTAVWVNPEVIKMLQEVEGNESACWWKNSKRADKTQKRRTFDQVSGEYLDDNPNAIMKSLTGLNVTPNTFVICHIFDEGRNTYDSKYFSSIANMVLIPKPISELDRHKNIKDLLKYRSYDLYRIKFSQTLIKPKGYNKLDWRNPLELTDSVKKKVQRHIEKTKCTKT